MTKEDEKIYGRYVDQLVTLEKLKRLKEEIDHNRSISSK